MPWERRPDRWKNLRHTPPFTAQARPESRRLKARRKLRWKNSHSSRDGFATDPILHVIDSFVKYRYRTGCTNVKRLLSIFTLDGDPFSG